MRTRPALVLALVASLVTAGGVASAAPKSKPKPKPVKPVCNVVTDEKNDTFLVRSQDGVQPGPQENGLDLVSADLASDGKTVTAAIRVVDIDAAVPTAPGGRGFDINFAGPANTSEIFVRATISPTGAVATEAGSRGETVGVTRVSTVLGTGTGVLDAAKNEVRFSFPVAVFATVGGFKVGDTLSFGEITTGRAAGPRAVFADVAVPGTTYKVGTPSCVPLGK